MGVKKIRGGALVARALKDKGIDNVFKGICFDEDTILKLNNFNLIKCQYLLKKKNGVKFVKNYYLAIIYLLDFRQFFFHSILYWRLRS